jgi:hypothetical protein
VRAAALGRRRGGLAFSMNSASAILNGAFRAAMRRAKPAARLIGLPALLIDALFRQSIRPGRDFQQAFDSARMLIQGWELMDRARPSNPQAHFGAAMVAKLAPLFQAQQAGN